MLHKEKDMSEKETHNFIDLLKAKAGEILPLGSSLRLYGSRARGEARKDSDWDLQILVPGDEQLPWSLWDVYAWPLELLGLKHNQLVNVRLYSFKGWLKRQFLPFYKNVERDAITLFTN